MTKLYAYILLFVATFATAQEPGDVAFTAQFGDQPENTFLYRTRYSNPKIAVQSDGKFIITSGRGLERVDGNLRDLSFETRFQTIGTYDPTQVLQLQSLPNGKTLLLTKFGVVEGAADDQYFVRLNQDGSLDSSFSHTLDAVEYFEVQPDGKILVTAVSDLQYTIYRLNEDGSLDPTFNFSAEGLASQRFFLLPDGKIIILGQQDTYMVNIMRLNNNGSLDSSFYVSDTGYNSLVVNAVLPLTDGRLIVGGYFDSYDESQFENLMMLSQDGTLNTSFNFDTEHETIPVPTVEDLAIQANGKILVAFNGGLYAANINQSFGSIVRLNLDGSIDESFQPNIDNQSIAVTVLPNQDIIVQVRHNSAYNTAQIDGVAKLDSNGARDSSFNNEGFSGAVLSMVCQPDGKIILGGEFKYFDGLPVNKIIRLNTDGTLDETFNVGQPILHSVNSLALLPDGKIIAGGVFSIGSSPYDNLIRLNSDGSTDTSFTSTDLGGRANVVTLLPDGKILVGGQFTLSHQNRTYKSMVRLNQNGTVDSTFFDQTDNSVGFNNPVLAIVVQPDGKILVGGLFTQFYLCNFCNAGKIARLNSDGTRDMTFYDVNLNGTVHSIALEQSGNILVGGDFNVSSYPGQKKFVRLWPNGIIKDNFTYYSGITKSIIVQPDNQILVAGLINGIDNNSVNNLARLNPNASLDYNFNVGSGFNGEVTQMEISPTGHILLAGNFTTYKGLPARRFLALHGNDFFTVTGMNRFDVDNNGCTETDHTTPFLTVTTSNGNVFVPNITGQYELELGVGSHTLTPSLEHAEYFTINPSVVNVEFPLQTAPLTQNFCISKNGVFPDLEVFVLPLGEARPGFDAKYRIVYKNKGTEIATGSVTFTFDGAICDVVTTTPLAANATDNSVTWNFENLDPFEFRMLDVTLNFNTPQESPALIGGENISFAASLSPTVDQTPNDNTFTLAQTVINAFDPNDKTCLQGNLVGLDVVGQYVHYMIRFENLGNGSAKNIYILDEIDTDKFDISTLTPLNGSHLFTTKIYDGNRVKFLFENINLPFTAGSNTGYVAFKIKTVATLEIGDDFSNSAAIYFDYNHAILTNNEVTTIGVLSTTEFTPENQFVIYPNPVSDILYIAATYQAADQLEIYNLSGQMLMAIANARQLSNINVSHLPIGVYFLRVKSADKISSIKFIKM
ncbi:MAG: T9SS type A sorting domain-containing protein [Flavobacterium sp.]|nr:T9SS type A sorting domain-containing protein [Flavobacterium sp.]